MFLYNLIIHPIRQLLEICYIFFTEVTGSPGISVIGLSFVVTLCCLPLYIVAEDWQEKERLVQKKLKPGIARPYLILWKQLLEDYAEWQKN